jgi:hypothetical protein
MHDCGYCPDASEVISLRSGPSNEQFARRINYEVEEHLPLDTDLETRVLPIFVRIVVSATFE